MQQSLVDLALQMHERVDLKDPRDVKKYIGFTPLGENLVGIRQRSTAQMEDDTLEFGPNGMQQIHRDPLGLYVVFGGTPHHTRHIYGYWHINDVDEMYVTIGGDTPESPASRLLIMRNPRPGERDMFAWYCDHCLAMIHCVVHQTGTLGFETFWKAEDAAVRQFNADPKLRKCRNCGWVHPLSYHFMDHKNTPEEAAAKASW
ncbi:MAG: hypothetical protein JOZ39_05985 [Chloroflexi bacterium]|nr:hypothetical protein [Chloroflexota bacterium]